MWKRNRTCQCVFNTVTVYTVTLEPLVLFLVVISVQWAILDINLSNIQRIVLQSVTRRPQIHFGCCIPISTSTPYTVTGLTLLCMKSVNIIQFGLETWWTGMFWIVMNISEHVNSQIYIRYERKYVNNAAHAASPAAPAHDMHTNSCI